MQLPPPSLHFMRFVRFAYYVAARLKRAGHADWAAEARAVGDEVRAAGRAVEDRSLDVIDRIAERDAIDDGMDDDADGARRKLASVSNSAHLERPYTDVLPNGIAYVTDAPLDDQETRYRDFAARLEQYLPEDDPARPTAASIREKLPQWSVARSALTEARSLEGRAKTDFDGVHERFELTMDRVYGRVVEKYGRKKAERFFPRARRSDERDADEGGGGEGPTKPA